MIDIYREFLKLCQKNGLHVWADPHLKRDKRTTGHWNGENHISVFRPGIKQVTGYLPNSPEDSIPKFIDGSPDAEFELYTLLHEYGHWHHKHPTIAHSSVLYRQEEEAWEIAEQIGSSLGIKDFSNFLKQKESSLEGYRVGLGVKPYRTSYLSHVEIYVSDYAKSIRFYDMILIPLGWERLVCQKSHTTYSDGATKIVFCPTDDKYLREGYHRKRVGMNHLAFYASSKEVVDRLFRDVLLPNGIECLYEKKPSGEDDYYAVFFEDPDRIKIEVVYSPGYCSPEHWTNQVESDFDPYAGAAN